MAIYHLSLQTIGRGQGRSVVNAAAYRAADKILDEHLGKTFSYEHKAGVEYKEILAPESAPAWATDRAKLWNAVEAAEKRKDARLAREINIALPVELTSSQQEELVRGYVREQFVARGMVADVCIHRDNPAHPHAHVMLTDRTIQPDGFGKKDPSWNRRDLVLTWRGEWANHANHALVQAGQHVQIDHRSYKDQGIDLEPQSKIGRARGHEDGRELVHERMAEHEAIAKRNGDRILAEPNIALVAITHQRATFTRQDVGRWLNTHTVDAVQFQACLDRVMASPELVALGKDARANERYTTREMLEVERRMVDSAQAMAERQGHEVSAHHQEQGERVAKLSADQRRAFDHIMQPADVAVVQGYAGAGKSFMLGAAREAWEAEGYNVKGGALAGKAAEGLQISAGITSRSLHAWEYAWSQGRDRLTSKDVLVIDEAGMVGSRQLGRVLDHARAAGAKVVLVGDTRQLQAIEAGAPMRMIGERVGQVTMEDIRRQKDAAQKRSSELLAQGEVSRVLRAYERIGRVHEYQGQAEARQAIVKDWATHRRLHPDEVQIMLAFKRDDVLSLNLAAREKMREAGVLRGKDQRVETPRGPRDFAIGDRVYFTKNDRQLGVLNGSLGTLEAGRGPVMTVRLDDGRRVAFDVREYNHLDHGYAATVHKAQGVTVDRAHVLADSHFDQHVAYVALTRHRDQMDLHWSREEFADEAKMHAVLGRERMKDVAVDYEKTVVDNRRLEAEAQKPERRGPAQAPEREKVLQSHDPSRPFIAHISVEGVEWMSKTGGPTAGNALYQAADIALAKVAPDAARWRGDFVVRCASVEDGDRIAGLMQKNLTAALREANPELAGRLMGFEVSVAVVPEGADPSAAIEHVAASHEAVKQALEDASPPARAKRGERPFGIPVKDAALLHMPSAARDLRTQLELRRGLPQAPAPAKAQEVSPQEQQIEERLGRLEDAEHAMRRAVRMLDIYSPERAAEALSAGGPNARYYVALQQGTKERAQLERDLGLASVKADIDLQDRSGDPVRGALGNWGKLYDKAHAAWCAWREAHTPKERCEARRGRGKGAKLFASYGQIRANEGAASKAMHIELVQERNLERDLGGIER